MTKFSGTIFYGGDEHADRELLVIDKEANRIAVEYGEPIYNDIELDTKIYETLNQIKKSTLWKLPISISIEADLEEKTIDSIHIYY